MRTRAHIGWLATLPLLLVTSVSGCHTVQPATPLTVYVRDAETQAPVPGATVRLWRFGSHESEREKIYTTGTDGGAQARVAPPDEGGVMVDVTADGFLSAQITLPADVSNALASAKPLRPYAGPPLSVTVDVFSGPRPTVELILPPNFRGPVKVELRTRPDGTAWPAKQRTFTYQVPADGVVRAEGPPVFGQGVGPEILARYGDGTPLPKDGKADAVAFRWIRREGDDVYFVVGTNADAEEARRKLGSGADMTAGRGSSDKPPGGGRRGGGGGGMGGGRGGRMGGGMGR